MNQEEYPEKVLKNLKISYIDKPAFLGGLFLFDLNEIFRTAFYYCLLKNKKIKKALYSEAILMMLENHYAMDYSFLEYPETHINTPQ
ncbi:hypothetical protein [Oxobacter pfennigii]|uniref:hypothetical protein n=1 Tax=Oxobacter pfennigii TaxID=36849 RepID=UPI0006D417E2|nr:hypothetical protein [Oxobacter pfennigii]